MFAGQGMRIALAARRSKTRRPVRETGALPFACDATDPEEVTQLFDLVDRARRHRTWWSTTPAPVPAAPSSISSPPRWNRRSPSAPSAASWWRNRQRGACCREHGAILFTGASASVKGYPQSAPFAMGKFALRGLAQSMARELAPQGIHVAHFVIDGGIRSAPRRAGRPARLPARSGRHRVASYLQQQPRSAWTWEMELRPWVEKF